MLVNAAVATFANAQCYALGAPSVATTPTSLTATLTVTPSSSGSCTGSSASGLSQGALIGIIIGSVLGGIAIAVLIVILVVVMRRNTQHALTARLKQNELRQFSPNYT